MELKPYPKYKDSRAEWIGDIPNHWETKRLKYSFQLKTEKSNSNQNQIALENVESWTGKYIATDSEFDGEGISFKNNYILFGKLRPYLAKVYLTQESGAAIGDFFVLCPNEKCFPKFAMYFMLTKYFITIINGSTYGAKMPRVSWEFFRDMKFPIIPFMEQQKIASFLDRETSRIDSLIAKKYRQIELLQEKRAALISRAVTKGLPAEAAAKAGLNPDVRLKPSGVEWLGDVPVYWGVKKLSWLFWYSKGLNAATLTKEYVGSNSGDFPVYSGQTENDGLMGMIDSYEFDFTNPVILVTTVGAKAMTTRLLLGKFSLSQNCALIIPRGNNVNSHYYESLLQPLFDYEKRSISLIMQPSLRFEDLNRFRVPLPPIDEQVMIAEHITQETGKIDGLIRKVTEAIEKLKEYRTALISAAVTGKIDVRDWQPQEAL